MHNFTYPIALASSLQANNTIATSQILLRMHNKLGFDLSKKLLLRLLPLLSIPQRQLLKSLS